MRFPAMTLLFLALGVVGNACAADIYKCVKDGSTTYQNKPCDRGSQATQLEANRSSSLVGCYASTMKGFEDGFQIKRTADGGFVLEAGNGKDKQSLPMKAASTDELLDMGKALHSRLSEGISMKWEKGTPNQRPVGVYKGRDTSGKEAIFGFFFFDSGWVTATPCK